MNPEKLNKTALEARIRLEPAEKEFACLGGRSVNGGIVFCLSTLQAIYSEALKELRNFFTLDEWNYMQIVMEGERPREATKMCSKDNLIRILLKARNAGAAELTGIHPQELVAKIERDMTAAHIYAIWTRVLDFHDHKRELGDQVYKWLEY